LMQRLMRRVLDIRMLGEAKVIVGAEIQDFAAIGEADVRALRRADVALAFPRAGGADGVELGGEMLLEIGIHEMS
jgi:hypothetical protein